MNIVFYSYKMSPSDHVNQHEIKRFEHSISSLREFNNTIPVYLFCDNPEYIKDNSNLEDLVNIQSFVDGNDHGILFIYRWFNLKFFQNNVDANILYLDSDTIFYDDVEYLFNHYNYASFFGREEFGFRHDPNNGGGKKIRESLDYVDECIKSAGGKTHIYKYCCGVVLFNNGIHLKVIDRLNELLDLMYQLKNGEIPYPIPNPRIVDEYAFWVVLSRTGASNALFGAQDVTQGYIEKKHQEFFNPVVIHYTTKKEQEMALSDDRFSNLVRDIDEFAEMIDPYHAL